MKRSGTNAVVSLGFCVEPIAIGSENLAMSEGNVSFIGRH